MNACLPASVRHRLADRLTLERRPAYALITPDGILRQWGGCMEHYTGERPGAGLATDTFDVLEGLVPITEPDFRIPYLITRTGLTAELYLFQDGDDTWMVLLDATDEARRMQTLQQQANDLQLLKTEQHEMLERLRAHNAHLEGILDQLQVAAMRIGPGGGVLFINAFGRAMLDGVPATASHWRDVLPLDPDEADAFETRLHSTDASPDPAGRPTLHIGHGGRIRHLEADIRCDPRDPDIRIAYLYDISELQALRGRLHEQAMFAGMIGKSETMQRIFQLIRDVARTQSTVLIEGETGTGKELVARAIHTHSPRAAGPFIVVNCAGFTDSLINSQLFGHKKGAFTDAVSNQKGVFEAAHGGTILLDEIGDIPMNTQTRILRALEQREIIRIGETEARNVDIRILAATNKDLEKEVQRGNFRPDLLYRIRVARIRLPSLRERREDIPILAHAFVASLSAENGHPPPDLDPETLATLMAFPFPGNIRELRNALEFAVIRCRDKRIRPYDLPPEMTGQRDAAAIGHREAGGSGEAELVEALRAAGGRRTEAARQMGISRATLYRRMRQYGIGHPAEHS